MVISSIKAVLRLRVLRDNKFGLNIFVKNKKCRQQRAKCVSGNPAKQLILLRLFDKNLFQKNLSKVQTLDHIVK